MKPQEQKAEFIKMRAEGKSYAIIAETLNISKSTCTSWERELKDKIAQLKGEQLEELYSSYFMTKEARIKKLGGTLERINTALDDVDLSTMPPEKLLDFKLKYMDALKEEYISPSPAYNLGENFKPKDILNALGYLLNRIRTGEVTADQANRESAVISNLLKAYDIVELKEQLDTLETIMGRS